MLKESAVEKVMLHIFDRTTVAKMISSKAGPITELEARPTSMQPKRKAKLPTMTGKTTKQAHQCYYLFL